MEKELEIFRVILDENAGNCLIALKEDGGSRVLQIGVGFFEGWSLQRVIDRTPIPRPMAYELLAGVITAMGARLEKLVIHSLVDGTFIGKLVLGKDGKTLDIDCRPSDGIVLCTLEGRPIFAEGAVMDAAGAEMDSS